MTRPDAALYVASLRGGGAERVMVQLATGLSRRGHAIDLVLGRAEGPYLAEVPGAVNVHSLDASRVVTSLAPLVRYLRDRRPQVLLSTLNHVNVLAIIAAKASFTGTRVVVREASSVRGQVRDATNWRTRATPWAMRAAYRGADRVVAVSEAASIELAEVVGYPQDRIEVIYNPIALDEIRAKGAEPVAHPFFDGGEPVIVSVGRLSPEKEHDTLLRAVAILRERRPVRLIVLGEGAERAGLERLRSELGLESQVDLVGFVPNPFPYVRAADAVALASRWEGLPNVLIQSLALETPVVATDAPGGAREILMDGQLGQLVPVGKPDGLAEGLEAALSGGAPPALPAAWLDRFDFDRVVERYARAMGLEQ